MILFEKNECLLLISVFRNVRSEYIPSMFSVYFDFGDWMKSQLSGILFEDIQAGGIMLQLANLPRDTDKGEGTMSIPLYRKVNDLTSPQCEELHAKLKEMFHITSQHDEDLKEIQIEEEE